MIVYQHSLGRFQRARVEISARDARQHIGCHSLGGTAHGGDPQVGSMGDQRGQQGGRLVSIASGPRLVTGKRSKGSRFVLRRLKGSGR
jgi:hypothetical protein